MLSRRAQLSVGEIIHITEELEESRVSGHDVSILDDRITRNDQFEATRRWNSILSKFYRGMPRKKNRRQFRTYEDTFTGKEAVDFLLDLFPHIIPNKPFDAANAEAFMRLVIGKHLVENARDPEYRGFSNNASLYRFIDEKIQTELRDTAVKRSSSLVRSVHITSCSHFGRKSMSHNDLTKIARAHTISTAPPVPRHAATRRDEDDSLAMSKLTTAMSDLSTAGQAAFHASVPDGHGLAPSAACSAAPMPPIYVAADIDFYYAWKDMLLKAIGVTSLVDRLACNVIGADIKFNTTEIGSKNVVRIQNEARELSTTLKKAFDRLSKWTDTDQETISPNTVFDHLYQEMCHQPPLLSREEAAKLIFIWNHFHVPPKTGGRPRSLISGARQNQSSTSLGFDAAGIKYIDEGGDAVAGVLSDLSSSLCSSTLNHALLEAFSIFMVSLQPPVLRALIIICRYIRRIEKNPHLRLHGSKSNKHYLMDRLSLCIINSSVAGSIKTNPAIYRFIVDQSTAIFTPRQDIVSNAASYNRVRLENAVAPQPAAFCQRVTEVQYAEQKTNTDDQLLALLDSIVADENMNPRERSRKIAAYRVTYPQLYARRFPSSPPPPAEATGKHRRAQTPTGRIVQRIRSLTRRDSSKR